MALFRNSKNDKKNETKELAQNETKQSSSTGASGVNKNKINDNQPETRQDKTGGSNNSNNRMKPKTGTETRYGYHLTPEEQEIAYDLRANMMHKLENQNSNLQAELGVHQNVKALRKKQQLRPYAYRIATGTGISQHNMKLLMKSYEKKTKDAEDRINELENELDESRSLARRYHDMYLSEKEKGGKNSDMQSPGSARHAPKSSPRQPDGSKMGKSKDESKDGSKKKGLSKQTATPRDQKKEAPENQPESDKNTKQDNEKVTEEHLEDDEALFKRHIARIADTKSMRVTSPIRVQDVIRKNEVLIQENEAQKLEIQRLKWDNAQLVKKVKLASADKDKLLHMINTSEAARSELAKRLDKEIAKNQKLTKSLTRQAADWIQFKKSLQEMDDKRKLAMLFPMSPNEIDVQERTYSHPVKKNVYMPRYMFPVEQYAQANKST